MTNPAQILIPQSALAFTTRMGAGFPGTVSRTNLANILPGLIDSGNPPVFYGQGVVFDGTAQAFRPPTVGDTGIQGITVRAFPSQGNFPASPQVDPIGTSNCPTSGEVDVLQSGYISVSLSGTVQPIRYSPVWVWIGATSGSHVNGGFEAAPAYTFAEVANGAGGGGANTGNGTFTVGPTAGANIQQGNYSLKFLTATTFTLTAPNGATLPNGTSLVYSNAQISFTITAGGTAFVAGDGFLIEVGENTVPVPNSYFLGAPDSSGVTEIAFNI